MKRINNFQYNPWTNIKYDASKYNYWIDNNEFFYITEKGKFLFEKNEYYEIKRKIENREIILHYHEEIPSIIWPSTCGPMIEHYYNGKLHRLTGPALYGPININGIAIYEEIYYLDGKGYLFNDWFMNHPNKEIYLNAIGIIDKIEQDKFIENFITKYVINKLKN